MTQSDNERKLALWIAFCEAHRVLERSVPLFTLTADGRVASQSYGKDGRLILQRSAEMEELLVAAAERVVSGPQSDSAQFDGLLYMMLREDSGRVVPLYIGRAGKYGKDGGNLSANLVNIRRDRSKFARWGTNYAYHIGDLSAAACPGHSASKVQRKYLRWSERLFLDAPSATPTLRHPLRFWATAWGTKSQSIWQQYGSTSLAFEEYLLIGVGSDLFPADLLNDEGVNRPGPRPVDGTGATAV